MAATAKRFNLMDKKVPVFIPPDANGTKTAFVGFNGKSYAIPVGQNVMVPAPVAYVLMASNKNARYAEAYKASLAKQ